jgi:four helix bundle protein
MSKQENIVVTKSFEFALSIISLYKELIHQNEYILSKQLLRSGTSIGANVEEGTAAQTKKDFITKMAIASKEARETLYWLRLLESGKLANVKLDNQIRQCKELINIITAIVKTAQNSLAKPIQHSAFNIQHFTE